MIEFRNISLADKPWIDACVRQEDSRSADFNFANMYMWDGAFRQLVARVGDRMVAKPKYRVHPFFAFPIGSGDLQSAIEALRAYAAEREFPFCISGVTAEHREELDGLIARYSRGWKVGRISKTALAVLRVALFEILYVQDVPPAAAINEAVEQA